MVQCWEKQGRAEQGRSVLWEDGERAEHEQDVICENALEKIWPIRTAQRMSDWITDLSDDIKHQKILVLSTGLRIPLGLFDSWWVR